MESLFLWTMSFFIAFTAADLSGENLIRATGPMTSCSPNPCLDGGVCHFYPKTGTGFCKCPEKLVGRFCQHVSPCYTGVTTTERCLNQGKCIVDFDFLSYTSSQKQPAFQCECRTGYSAPLCESPLVNVCNSAPCQNGGNCSTDPGERYGQICHCPAGYEGGFCETDVNECVISEYRLKGVKSAANICAPSGKCRNTPGSFVCNCNKGYTGSRCEVNIDECASNPCQNNGTCLDSVGRFVCVCMPGFSGDNCETDIDECQNNPCWNSGSCLNQIPGFQCTCPPGFEGTTCEIVQNACNDAPCRNGAPCQPTNPVRCQCPPGSAGAQCEQPQVESQKIKWEKCDPAYCRNRGRCTETEDGLHCRCKLGFSGERCELLDDACQTNPCQNGGTCQPDYRPGLFNCECPPGYSGSICGMSNSTAAQETVLEPRRLVCPVRGCSAKAINGRCDEECNAIECDYDGHECSLHVNPWLNCTGKTRAPCWNFFRNGRCDPECNIAECLFDGFDCANSLGDFDLPCDKLYGNGRCDEPCNCTACDFDGLDCDNGKAKPIDGTLFVTVHVSPETFRSGAATLLRKLGRVLRSVATIKKDKGGKDEIMPRTAPGETPGTTISVQLDNRLCMVNCIATANVAASFLSVEHQRGELNLGYSLYSVHAQADRVVAQSSSSSFYSDSLYWLVPLGLVTVCVVISGAVMWSRNGRRRRATIWFPERILSARSMAALN